MAADQGVPDTAQPPVASTARLEAAVQRPSRLAALTAEALLDGPPEPVFDRFARVAAQATRSPSALVSLVAGDRQCFAGQRGVKQPWADARQTPLTHSFCQHVVANAAPLVVEDARTDPVLRTNLAIRDLDVVAYAGFPITGRDGEVLGSLCAIDDRPRVWTGAELEVLAEIALLVGNEIERRSLVQRLAADARTDVLTGLANRRAWDEELPRARHHAQRLSHGLSLAIVDVDRFKAYNDEHGHPAGDAVLREIGRRWVTHVRDIDVIARIGGEEFGLLLPGCTPAEALVIAERLRRDLPGGLTASVGIAEWREPMTVADLVAHADRALYRAKSEGRDRACVAPPPGS